VHGRFALGRPLPLIEQRLIAAHREVFEGIFDRRAAHGWRLRWTSTEERDVARGLEELLRRDGVRWRDSMGPTLTPEWAYFRWESGRLSETAFTNVT